MVKYLRVQVLTICVFVIQRGWVWPSQQPSGVVVGSNYSRQRREHLRLVPVRFSPKRRLKLASEVRARLRLHRDAVSAAQYLLECVVWNAKSS